MDEEYKKLQRHTRRVWILLTFLIVLALVGIVLTYLKPAPEPIVNNYVGQQGAMGASVQGPKGEAGYTPIKGIDYVDGKDGKDGVDGVDGTDGKDGIDGKDGTNGTNGADGQSGKTSEVDCVNGDFVTRYEGDDAWRVLQKNSAACQEAE